MQSLRQFREIGRFVEHTYHEEDNRSKEAPGITKPRTTPTLPLPNLGPGIERQWESDVEQQLDNYTSSQVWKSEPASLASIRTEKASTSSSCYSQSDIGEKSRQNSSSSCCPAELDKGHRHQDSDSSSSCHAEKPVVDRKSSSDMSSGPETLRPRESTESIISHFGRHHDDTKAIDQSHFFETPRQAPVPPSVPDRIIPVHSNGASDPTNPRNWPLSKRLWAFVIVAFLSFTQTWAGSADSSYTGAAAESLHVSRIAASLNTSAFSLGIGIGSLFVGPMSETFGRIVLFVCAGLVFLVSVMWTALSRNLASQVVSRLFVGLFSSVTGAVSGSAMHDLFEAKERSIMFPLLALMNTLPTALAPIPGGWICDSANLSFYWADWITLLISVPVWLAALFFLPETYSPLLQSWKAQHLRRVTGDERYRSGLETGGGLVARLKETLPRPIIFWCREPVIIILGIYTVVLNVLLFVFLSAFNYIFTDTYGFSTGETSTVFLAIGAGTIFSTMLTPIWYVIDIRALRRRQVCDGPDASFPPESRLWPSMVASPFFAISIFWLAWTNYETISPWSGITACFMFGYALISIQVSCFQYIIDSYGPYAASALGGITLARYLFAAGLGVAAGPMFQGLGVQWTLSIIGIIAALLVPAPWVFYKYGPQVRARSRYANYA